MTEKRSAKRRRLLWLLTAPALLLAAFLIYAAGYYRAGGAALAALASDDVAVEKTDYGWLFDGPAEDAVLVFYPGGKVEETAYAPLLHDLARRGADVCLVKMPFRLAVFGRNAADGVLARFDCARRYVGGHSLGGAMAASYAAERELDGVILLAAYPTAPLDEPMLLLCGSEDGVVNRARVAAAGQFGEVREIVIEGGNHAGFGDYGPQKGDGPAAVTPEEQRRLAAESIAAWLAELSAGR